MYLYSSRGQTKLTKPDTYENLLLNPALPPYLFRRDWPGTAVGRQFFVKVSYLFRM